MEKNKSLAKIYSIKAMYFLIAAFANTVTIIKTQNFDVTMLGLFLYFTPIAIENYSKNTYNLITVILRRVGYILPVIFLFFNLLIIVLVINFQGFDVIISEFWYIGVIIGVTIPLIFISILDTFLYGFNDEEIKASNDTVEYLKKNREQSRELKIKQEKEIKEEDRQFKVERSKRKG